MCVCVACVCVFVCVCVCVCVCIYGVTVMYGHSMAVNQPVIMFLYTVSWGIIGHLSDGSINLVAS